MPDHATSLPDRLERLVEASTELAFELSLAGVLQRVADLAAELMDAKYAAIGLLGPDGRTLESFVTHGIDAESRERMGHPPRGQGVLGVVIRKGEVLRLPDLTGHPDSTGFPPGHPPMRSFLGVPVVGRRGVLGDLYLTEKRGGLPFTEEDEHLTVLLAVRTAAAVENARLHEESARLLEEVQQLHRSRERFFAMVNHELRNALAATYGWAEMLIRKKDPTTVPRAAFEVMDSAEQAIALINDLLDLSRLDEDRLKPVFQDVSGEQMAKQALGRITPAAGFKDLTLTLRAAEDLPSCHTDARRVEQILLNLLTNAIRHSPPGGEISLAIERDVANLVFIVKDAGPGVPEEEIERIFDIYVTKTGEEREGTGLGLPLSRRLARLMGGELMAVSRGPSGGGEFVLLLPVAAAET
ncbi:MAG: ATP-binding protein [Gemmatimonadales bacterium]